MKTFFLLAAAASLCALAACQSSSVSATPNTLEPAGGQARYNVSLPNDNGTATSAQPYALRGTSSDTTAAPQGLGYQAR